MVHEVKKYDAIRQTKATDDFQQTWPLQLEIAWSRKSNRPGCNQGLEVGGFGLTWSCTESKGKEVCPQSSRILVCMSAVRSQCYGNHLQQGSDIIKKKIQYSGIHWSKRMNTFLVPQWIVKIELGILEDQSHRSIRGLTLAVSKAVFPLVPYLAGQRLKDKQP